MGKVGSSTVVNTLQSSSMVTPVLNIHTLEKFFLDRTERIYKSLHSSNKQVPQTLWNQQYIRKNLKRYIKRKRITIITLVRDPIARNVSHFFQYPNMIINRVDNGYRVKSPRYKYDQFITENNVQTLSKFFLEKIDNHERPLVWIDMELKRFFNIDVYASDFPKSKGFKIYRNGSVSALVLKLEKLNETFRDAFYQFLDIEVKQLHKANIGTDKESADLYKQFKRSIKLPETYVHRFYNSKFVNQFYTDAEIREFKARWL
jgi:hypothetical protein